MNKFAIIFSGLGAGTAVTGSTHLVKNVHPNLGKSVSKGESRESIEDLEHRIREGSLIESKSQSNPRNVPDTKGDSAESPGIDDQNPDDKTAESSEESQPISEPPAVVPKASSPKRQDTDLTYRGDDLPYTQPSPKNPKTVDKGTKAEPAVICVAEEIGDSLSEAQVTRFGHQGSKHYRLVCVKKASRTDYEAVKSLTFCEPQVMNGVNSSETYSEGLSNLDKKRCKYWDSFSNSQLQVIEDQIPEEFGGKPRNREVFS
ncbi:hypothetical protein MHLP_01780 [Candidatus Mycoplasma haematolamae str. Purdue]|uniref:Uncharacterized protein n=1 Tax=Mycoplasma haematolamae (strain Purdue) TaxID=1212765 RepID=I7CFF3_MYCHA|nr:hypothetical protein [Candidatus Mycoplasma haematolamae]AFO51936.1 hypothetical protein MHLP_01780 [Candidatus Mycoplasma haematolamae str. Purdue]